LLRQLQQAERVAGGAVSKMTWSKALVRLTSVSRSVNSLKDAISVVQAPRELLLDRSHFCHWQDASDGANDPFPVCLCRLLRIDLQR